VAFDDWTVMQGDLAAHASARSTWAASLYRRACACRPWPPTSAGSHRASRRPPHRQLAARLVRRAATIDFLAHHRSIAPLRRRRASPPATGARRSQRRLRDALAHLVVGGARERRGSVQAYPSDRGRRRRLLSPPRRSGIAQRTADAAGRPGAAPARHRPGYGGQFTLRFTRRVRCKDSLPRWSRAASGRIYRAWPRASLTSISRSHSRPPFPIGPDPMRLVPASAPAPASADPGDRVVSRLKERPLRSNLRRAQQRPPPPRGAAGSARRSQLELGKNRRLKISLEVQNAAARSNPEELSYSSDWSSRGTISGLPTMALLGLELIL